MTDNLRQSGTDKAQSALKPDSEKSTLEQASDKAKSVGDSVAGTAQPEEEKSMGQKASDTVSGTGESSGGMLDSVKDTLGMKK